MVQNSTWGGERFPHPHTLPSTWPQNAPTQRTSLVCSGSGLASLRTVKITDAVLFLLESSTWVDIIQLLGAFYRVGRRAGRQLGLGHLVIEFPTLDFCHYL